MSQESNNRITLQVGERCFTTTRSVLTDGSTYFSSLLSGRWEHSAEPDGSYFIDKDPDVFEHIITYLRDRVFPLFWDKANGHDYRKYASVLAQAKYFGIDSLQEYIEEQVYNKAIVCRFATKCLGFLQCPKPVRSQLDAANVTIKEVSFGKTTYECKKCFEVLTTRYPINSCAIDRGEHVMKRSRNQGRVHVVFVKTYVIKYDLLVDD